MSFLGKLFGGKKEEKGPSTHEAIQKLRETEELLLKKQEFLEKKIDIEVQTARKHGTKNKRGKFKMLYWFRSQIIYCLIELNELDSLLTCRYVTLFSIYCCMFRWGILIETTILNIGGLPIQRSSSAWFLGLKFANTNHLQRLFCA